MTKKQTAEIVVYKLTRTELPWNPRPPISREEIACYNCKYSKKIIHVDKEEKCSMCELDLWMDESMNPDCKQKKTGGSGGHHGCKNWAKRCGDFEYANNTV